MTELTPSGLTREHQNAIDDFVVEAGTHWHESACRTLVACLRRPGFPTGLLYEAIQDALDRFKEDRDVMIEAWRVRLRQDAGIE